MSEINKYCKDCRHLDGCKVLSTARSILSIGYEVEIEVDKCGFTKR